MKILFALNQDRTCKTEDAIIDAYIQSSGNDAEYDKEYDLDGITNALITKRYDIVFLNEELERDNLITTFFVDEITDKYPNLRVIILVTSDHRQDDYIKRMFNIGVYDILYSSDVSFHNLLKLIVSPRKKIDAKEYLSLSDVEDVVVESELNIIPEEQLNSILMFFEESELERIPVAFEHVYSQYNQNQLLYLCRHLSENIKVNLRGNELFDKLEEIMNKNDLINKENIKIDNLYMSENKGDKGIRGRMPGFNLNIKSPFSNNYTRTSDKLIGSVFIGVANSTRGAGSTYLTIALSTYLSSLGHSVAVVEMNNEPVMFNLLKDKSKNMFSIKDVDYYCIPKGLKEDDFPIPDFKKNYQYIISDLGIIKKMKNRIYTNGLNYTEFLRSNVKILMLSGNLWKWGEVYPFLIENKLSSWTLFVSPTIKKNKSLITKELDSYNTNVYFLPYCEDAFSPSDELIDVFNVALRDYIGNINQKKSKFKFPNFNFIK